ncbi:unnamed protein product [Dovyalis caffra]|uniref:Uncharacterized protein n=1 Tax=Dovyalis caffra TaxID=77055 RepID=A0AAV1RIA9_9ROSI|nr:unnamed protein product [Dovyalis caffra]
MPKSSAFAYSGFYYPRVFIRGPFSSCVFEEMAFWATPSRIRMRNIHFVNCLEIWKEIETGERAKSRLASK